jgi:NAD-dependent deacetylase
MDSAVALLRVAESVVVFTGAGMSKESGILTFRDAMEGLWENFSPEDLATPEAFERDTQRVRDFYEYRRGFVRNAKPNAGHLAIAAMEELFPEVIVVTQNVDCLHEAAGSTTVINLHGEILSNRCNRGCPGTQPGSRTTCPACGSDSLRPNVVWFGEPLDPILMSRARISVNCSSVLMVTV